MPITQKLIYLMDSNITTVYSFSTAKSNASKSGASDWQNDIENEWRCFHEWLNKSTKRL